VSVALFVSADRVAEGEVNSSYFRIAIPAEFLRRAGHAIAIQNAPPRQHSNGMWGDLIDYSDIPEVVVIERLASPEMIERLRLAGAKRILLTFDDNYALIPPESRAALYWRDKLPDWLAALPLVDEVLVPSRQLAKDFGHRCRKMTVVPNYHDAELWIGDLPEKPDYKIIGWGGSREHADSWTKSGIIPALADLLGRHPDWRLHLYGYAIHRELDEARIPYQHFPWMDLGSWARSVRSFDIGLAPLHGDYDKRRSNLKVLEYGLAGIPYVASQAAPYLHDGNPGGRLAVTTGDWTRKLESLMIAPEERVVLGEAGRVWAQNYTMDKGVAVYERVLWP
jgi:hypothetical protein